jgi:pilus assembly protein FimV
MRDKGGYWQVVEVIGIYNFTGLLEETNSKIGNELDEKNDNMKKDSDPDGNLKIDTFNIKSKFIYNDKEGKLFLITGRVKNGYSDVRGFISITVKLYTKGKNLAQTETVFCGNILSDIELTNMIVGEIKKRLSNRLGDNKSNMQIKPGGELPFMLVFSNLPDDLDEFSIMVKSSSPVSQNGLNISS